MTDALSERPAESAPGSEKPLRSHIGRVAAASAVALVVGELITVGQTVALARLLSPTEVGIFVAGTVLVTFVGTFAEGGLRAGLVHREDHLADAAETVFYATTIGGVLMAMAALAAAPVIGMLVDDRHAGVVAAASSGVVLLHALTNVPEAMLQREFSVRRRLIVGPAVAVSYAGVAVTTAALGWGVWSMVAGLYASSLVWVVSLWMITDWRPGRGRASMAMWRESARYGRPLVLGMIGARVQSVAETTVVGGSLSPAALGQFRYGQRIALIPVRGIIEVGATSLFPAFSRIRGDADRLRVAYLRAVHWAFVGSALVGGLMIALGTPAVVVVLGEPWRQAGVVVVAMSGLGLGKALISVSEEAIKGGGRTGLLNWYTATEVLLGIGLLVALVHLFGVVGAGAAISATAVMVGITCVCLAALVVRFSTRDILGALLPPLPCAALSTAITAALEHLVLQSDTRPIVVGLGFLAIDTAVFVVTYVAGLAVAAPATTSALWRLVGRARRTLRTR
ncbi:oligosaccharide flippase family protein [Desertimonas flava]|uniref:oligosaccharide flippase family protein n=1 Tax=Desertimonas flava TaxID=2064846 RepID=UPI000E352A33|nr:oligosaccharide flippase family protein [Desertimonas flava]